MPSSGTPRSWRYDARSAVADDVYLRGEERVGGADHGPDVEVVLPVLDRDVEVVPVPVEIGDDRLEPPVAVPVDHVAAVTLGEQALVVLLADGPLPGPRPDADLGRTVGHRVVRRSLLVGHQNAAIEPCARWGRVNVRTRAVDPWRRTASPVSRSRTGATTSSGNSGVSRSTLAARSSECTTVSIIRVTRKS
jgi:hypothetical protein